MDIHLLALVPGNSLCASQCVQRRHVHTHCAYVCVCACVGVGVGVGVGAGVGVGVGVCVSPVCNITSTTLCVWVMRCSQVLALFVMYL